jgi:hypothetical protein
LGGREVRGAPRPKFAGGIRCRLLEKAGLHFLSRLRAVAGHTYTPSPRRERAVALWDCAAEGAARVSWRAQAGVVEPI